MVAIAIPTPALTASTRRTLLDAVNVSTDIPAHALYRELDYDKAITNGANRDAPVSAGPLAAPALTKGATGTSGGTFGAGTFFWKVTAVDGTGETVGSNEVTATLVATGNQALSWVAVPGAQLYRIYRGTATNTENVLVATVSGLVFTDTGAAGTAQAIPTVSTAGDAPAADKVFDKRDLDDTTTLQVFTAYRGADEPLLNGPGAYAPELEALFEAAEPLFVEAKVQKLLLSPAAVDLTPTPGTAVKDLDAALGLLEQWIATRYQFQPLISGDLLAVDLIQKGRPPMTETVHGTPIASAAGFGTDGPGSAVSGAGQAWLYISGQINVFKGEAKVNTAPDPIHNRDFSLVEKSYAVSIDGPVAAILVGF